MAVLTIPQLLEKFGPGDAPRSDDYIDLIDTLADDRNAVYFDTVEPADTAANPLWFNTSTNELSVYSGGQWNTVQGSGGSSTNISATSPLSYNSETGELSIDLSEYDTSSEVDTKLGNYDTSSEVNNKVSAAISNLVDTAPATLDTLNELATALGDDPNFATTVTNQIAGKADITGASFSGNVTINDSAFTIDSLGGAVPNFVMQGDGEQTFRFHNTAPTGSTRVSWKMANRIDPDWSWILYTDTPSDGTQDLVFANRNGISLYLGEGNQVRGNFVSQVVSKSTSFTITNNDAGKTINSTGGAITVTIPDVLLPGDRIDFVQQGAGQITFAASGVTLNAADGRSQTRTQYSVASVICISAGVYVLGGDIT